MQRLHVGKVDGAGFKLIGEVIEVGERACGLPDWFHRQFASLADDASRDFSPPIKLSAEDLTSGKRLLKLHDSAAADVGSLNDESPERLHFCQRLDTRIGDFHEREAQQFQIRPLPKRNKTHVRNGQSFGDQAVQFGEGLGN